MKISIRAALVLACLALLVLPAAASSESTPPQPTPKDCLSRNTIEFNGLALYQVRHTMFMRCGVPVNLKCQATLFKEAGILHGLETVSTVRTRVNDGSRSCTAASRYAPQNAGLVEGLFATDATNQGYRQRFRYELKLRRSGQTWSGTTGFCPRRKDGGRTLVCRDGHSTRSPRNSMVQHP